jgi:LmbE family N-acetylglucosaminyl deacetylase
VRFLDYIDGELDQADPEEAVRRIVGHLRRVRPQVVLTFDPQGAYGHPDHIATCQLTTAAVLAAADPGFAAEHGSQAHRVSKLYYMVNSGERRTAYLAAFGDVVMQVDGVERRGTPWPNWAITACLDTTPYTRQVWRAVACHRSQLPNYAALEALSPAGHALPWGRQEYYRASSLVNGGQRVERDLFEGIGAPSSAQVTARSEVNQ